MKKTKGEYTLYPTLQIRNLAKRQISHTHAQISSFCNLKVFIKDKFLDQTVNSI